MKILYKILTTTSKIYSTTKANTEKFKSMTEKFMTTQELINELVKYKKLSHAWEIKGNHNLLDVAQCRGFIIIRFVRSDKLNPENSFEVTYKIKSVFYTKYLIEIFPIFKTKNNGKRKHT